VLQIGARSSQNYFSANFACWGFSEVGLEY